MSLSAGERVSSRLRKLRSVPCGLTVRARQPTSLSRAWRYSARSLGKAYEQKVRFSRGVPAYRWDRRGNVQPAHRYFRVQCGRQIGSDRQWGIRYNFVFLGLLFPTGESRGHYWRVHYHDVAFRWNHPARIRRLDRVCTWGYGQMVCGHNHFSRHYWIDPALRFAAALIALIIKGLRNKMTGVS